MGNPGVYPGQDTGEGAYEMAESKKEQLEAEGKGGGRALSFEAVASRRLPERLCASSRSLCRTGRRSRSSHLPPGALFCLAFPGLAQVRQPQERAPASHSPMRSWCL